MAVAVDATMTAGNSADGLNQEAAGVTTISSTGITVGVSATLLTMVLTTQRGAGLGGISSPSATWNGVSMTLAKQQDSGDDSSLVFTIVNPASGAKTLAASWTGGADAYMSAVSFTGTDTATGIKSADTISNTQATAISPTTSSDGATVANFAVNGSPPTVDQTKIYSEAALAPGGGASYAIGGSGTNTHNFTGAGGTAQALVAVHVIAPAGATGFSADYGVLRSRMREW